VFGEFKFTVCYYVYVLYNVHLIKMTVVRYIYIAFRSLRLLDISITLDFWSLKFKLFSLDHFVIWLISMFVKFSTSATVVAFTTISRKSAKAIVPVHFAKFRFSSELY